MAASVASCLLGRSIVSRGLTKCSRPQYLRLRASQLAFRPTMRCFSASRRELEKKYSEDHEWVELSADGKMGTIGISEYAAKALGDVVYVELPTADMEVNKGDAIGAVESVKSASDIMTPITGKIVEANNVLEEKPATINRSPEADGWLAKIEVTDPSELESLMDAQGYKQFTEETESK